MRVAIRLLPVMFLGVLGCGSSPAPEKEWPAFAKTVHQAIQSKDIEALRKLTSTLAEGREAARALQAANPEMEKIDLDLRLTDADIASANRKSISKFLETYADLLKDDSAVIGFDRKPTKGVEDYAVILWVKHEGKYRGMRIHTVTRTGRGLVIGYWGHSSNNPFESSAPEVLEADSLEACKSQTKSAYEF